FLRNRFYFSSRRRHTRFSRDWSSDVCSSDLKSISAEPSSADRSATSGTCLALYGAGLLIASVDDDELPARPLAAHVILHHEVVDPGRDDLIVEGELVPGIAVGILVMLDGLNELPRVREEADRTSAREPHELDAVGNVAARIRAGEPARYDQRVRHDVHLA